jgi:hypothetical protein
MVINGTPTLTLLNSDSHKHTNTHTCTCRSLLASTAAEEKRRRQSVTLTLTHTRTYTHTPAAVGWPARQQQRRRGMQAGHPQRIELAADPRMQGPKQGPVDPAALQLLSGLVVQGLQTCDGARDEGDTI